MDTVTAVMTTMTTINHAITVAKNLRDVDLKLNEAENKNKISDLYNTLSDVKMDFANLKAVIIERDEEIRMLKRQLKISGEMKYNGVFYFKHDGESKEGPFCAQCFDSEQKLIRLHNYAEGWWECKTCENRYDENFRNNAHREVRRTKSEYNPFDRW